MANLSRKIQKVFAQNAANNGQFGSLQAVGGILSDDPSVLQALPAFTQGWDSATISGDELPAVEELQGLQYVLSRNLAYCLNKGIPEWDSETEYFIGDIQREVGGTKIYKSITDDNTNNILTNTTHWALLVDLTSPQVQAASQGEVTAGVVANKFVAPSTLAGLFNNSSRTANGYIRIPVKVGGVFIEIIIQWGSATGSGIKPYPIIFPTAALQVYTNLLLNGGQGTITYSGVLNGSINSTNFQSLIDSDNGVFNWLAIGY